MMASLHDAKVGLEKAKEVVIVEKTMHQF